MGGAVAATGDEQVLQLLRQQRAIRDVVGVGLNFLRVEVVRAADDGLVRMQIQIPAAGGDGVIEAAGLHQVVFVQQVLAHEPARLAHANPRIRLNEVALLEARHLSPPRLEHRPRIRPALHLGAREVGGIGRVCGHADAVDVNLALVVEEHHAGAVVERQFTRRLCLRERGAAVLAQVADALHVADAEMQRERLNLRVLLERRAGPRSDIRVAGAVNHRVRLHVHEAVLVGDLHGANASVRRVHRADEGVEQHGEPLLLLARTHVQDFACVPAAEDLFEDLRAHRTAALFQVRQHGGIAVEAVGGDRHHVVLRAELEEPRHADRTDVRESRPS